MKFDKHTERLATKAFINAMICDTPATVFAHTTQVRIEVLVLYWLRKYDSLLQQVWKSDRHGLNTNSFWVRVGDVLWNSIKNSTDDRYTFKAELWSLPKDCTPLYTAAQDLKGLYSTRFKMSELPRRVKALSWVDHEGWLREQNDFIKEAQTLLPTQIKTKETA